MAGHSFGSLGLLYASLFVLGCSGADMRAAVFDPSASYSGYGYSTGGSSAGSSSWSGYSGVAPTVASPPPTARPPLPTLALHVPRLQYGTVTLAPLSPAVGSLRLSTPPLHTRRSEGWHHRP